MHDEQIVLPLPPHTFPTPQQISLCPLVFSVSSLARVRPISISTSISGTLEVEQHLPLNLKPVFGFFSFKLR
ncbi:hypothetical protein V6N13_114323 [Hibiscus sabdariffa]